MRTAVASAPQRGPKAFATGRPSAQHTVQRGHQHVGVLSSEHHGWAYLENVVMRTDPADQDTALAHGIHDPLGGRCIRLPLGENLHREKHTLAANIANDRILLL